ncbi:hypothetical protein [Nostoc sp.]|uniref:hypothetical protein n=1 Tax=Nostoc sp. TaxID=1180 RepID=UPI002FFC9AA0
MTSPLARIESHPQSAKRLLGINYEQFMTLVVLAEQRHNQKQTEIEKIKFVLLLLVVDVNQKCLPKKGSIYV